jgi:MEDS: MEthanogen/methylotroph, DcmR Sensory domain
MSDEIEQVGVEPGRHVVQFYGGEDELVDHVGRYLGEALEAGDTVLVVATSAHQLAFEAWLAAAGTDVAAARASGAFLAVDAAGTMHRFLLGDQPDPDGFESVIGGLMLQAAAASRPVRVYGEMVALLWDAGHVNAAIELEELWNRLGEQMPFSLFCAYPAQSVSAEGHAAALNELCRLHSAVTGRPPTAPASPPVPDQVADMARSFAKAPDAPRAARHFVVDTLSSLRDRALADNAAIVTAELTTNAVVHARSDFSVTISCSAAAVRISVRDAGPLPLPGSDSPLVASPGRGLGLVAAVAMQWAAEPVPGGKRVWAELRRSLPPTSWPSGSPG